MVVGVVGAGALGTLVAWSLALQHDVRVAVRDAPAGDAIERRGGVVVEGMASRRVRVGTSADVFDGVDLVVITVKTYATVPALARFAATLVRRAPLVSLQNGADAVAAVDAALGPGRPIALAPTTEAATSAGAGVARRAANGTTFLGWARGRAGSGELETFARAMNDAGLAAHVVAPIEPHVWAKLVASVAINPLTALARVRNGELLYDPVLRLRAAAIAREVAAVARAACITLPFDDPVAYVECVARATAANRSSMLQDIEQGRPTEIEAIAGTVVKRAAELGVAVPQTARVLDEVRERAKA